MCGLLLGYVISQARVVLYGIGYAIGYVLPLRRRLSMSSENTMFVCMVIVLVCMLVLGCILYKRTRHYARNARAQNTATLRAQEHMSRVAHRMVELSEATEHLSEIAKRRLDELKAPVVVGVQV